MGEPTAFLGDPTPLPASYARSREILTVESVLSDIGLVEIEVVDDGPRPSPDEDPGEGWWRNRLFPNDCTAKAQSYPWRHEGVPILGMRVRHMPGRRTLLMAEAALGERARPLLAEWRSLWAGCDVDRLDVGLRVGDVARREEDARLNRVAGHRALARGDESGAATMAAEDVAMGPPEPAPVRPAAFHVLEDAAVQLALARCGVPFAFEAARRGETPVRFAPAPNGGLRRLLPEEPAYAQAAAAMAQSCGGAQPYWRSPAFRERAGRPMAVAGNMLQARAILVDMARQGHPAAFLKACEQKAGTWTVDIAGVRDIEEAFARVVAAMGADFLRVNFSGALLIQEHVPFLREHRFLVVGHRVVASTASVRSLSVLDAVPSRILHPFTAELDRPAGEPGPYDRGESAARPDRALVARMALGARDLARAMGCEPGLPDLYTIDMGLTADGRVLPIEVNGLAMAGLYAAHYPRVASALARRHARSAGALAGAPPAAARREAFRAGGPAHRDPTEAAALSFTRQAMSAKDSPQARRFTQAHACEVSAYIAQEFPQPSRAALREAVSRFEPALHDGWRGRYEEWLGRTFREAVRAEASTLEREVEAGSGLVGYVGVHGSHWWVIDATRTEPRNEANVGTWLLRDRPGPDDDILESREEDGVLLRIEASHADVDLPETARTRILGATGGGCALRRGAVVRVTAAWDHATGEALPVPEPIRVRVS